MVRVSAVLKQNHSTYNQYCVFAGFFLSLKQRKERMHIYAWIVLLKMVSTGYLQISINAPRWLHPCGGLVRRNFREFVLRIGLLRVIVVWEFSIHLQIFTSDVGNWKWKKYVNWTSSKNVPVLFMMRWYNLHFDPKWSNIDFERYGYEISQVRGYVII